MLATKLFDALGPEVEKFQSYDYANKAVFARHLCLIRQVIEASEGLLEEAAQQESPCQAYFAEHLDEERGHARWLEQDIKNLGADPCGLDYAAVAFAGSQYYLIKHVSPLALLGYMAVLEGYPMSDEHIAKIEELYPDSAHTLKYHAIHDKDHRAELMRQLELVPDELHDLVIWNAVQSARMYAYLLSQ